MSLAVGHRIWSILEKTEVKMRHLENLKINNELDIQKN